MLPDGDGVEVCHALREFSDMPILLLSALGDEERKVSALDAGADDYLTKPFSPRELVRNRGPLVTHRTLLTQVWGPGYAEDVATLRTAIARLRRKLERDGAARSRYIRTDAGVGYRLVGDA